MTATRLSSRIDFAAIVFCVAIAPQLNADSFNVMIGALSLARDVHMGDDAEAIPDDGSR